MKTANWMVMFLLAGGLVGALALTGCGKQKPAAPTVGGVTVDMPKLREAFATAAPELQTAISEVNMGIRYGEYARAIAGLDKLSNAPGITEAQKKIVSEVTEQIKALANKPATPPAPAQ
jgi:acetate kinase